MEENNSNESTDQFFEALLAGGAQNTTDEVCDVTNPFTVFLELRSKKTFLFSKQVTSADNYRSIFSRHIEAIVYICEIVGW